MNFPYLVKLNKIVKNEPQLPQVDEVSYFRNSKPPTNLVLGQNFKLLRDHKILLPNFNGNLAPLSYLYFLQNPLTFQAFIWWIILVLNWSQLAGMVQVMTQEACQGYLNRILTFQPEYKWSRISIILTAWKQWLRSPRQEQSGQKSFHFDHFYCYLYYSEIMKCLEDQQSKWNAKYRQHNTPHYVTFLLSR